MVFDLLLGASKQAKQQRHRDSLAPQCYSVIRPNTKNPLLFYG